MFLKIIFIALISCLTAWPESTGAPPPFTYSGAPGEDTCAACHGNGTVNSGFGSLRIQGPGGAPTYVPGQSVRLTITVSDPIARRWGFEVKATTGTLTVVDAAATRRINTNTAQYITHTQAGTRAGTGGSSSWDFDWTPPSTPAPVKFYAAGNAANNNNDDDPNDRVYRGDLTLTPADAGPGLPSNFRVMPQFVFGSGDAGSWYSAIFFYNSNESEVSFKVHFFGENGQPVSPPGGNTQTINIAAKGTVVIEAPHTGAQTLGWAAIELPSNVFANGVFRLSGSPDQEAVVPMSSNASTNVILTFDERDNLRTGVAVTNPTTSVADVTITVRDDAGQVVGTTTVALAAMGKQIFFLRDRGPLSGIAGKKGTVEFTTSAGAVAVLGLRVRDRAFTSIPSIER